jgi:chloramphenicol O-acetyltransferase
LIKSLFIAIGYHLMVKRLSINQKETLSTKTASSIQNNASNIQDVIETIQNSIIDVTNQVAKVQPLYAQSISNFQVEYLEATKKVLQNLSEFQSTFLQNNWNNFDNRSASYAEQIRNQVNTVAENFVKTCHIWNQITINSIDISRENIKMYVEAMTSMEKYNRNLINS